MVKAYKRLVFLLGQFGRTILRRIREAHFASILQQSRGAHFVSLRFSSGSTELTFLRFDSPVDLVYHCRQR